MEALLVASLLLAAVIVGAGSYFVHAWFQRRYLGRYGYVPKTFMTGNEVDFYRRLQAAAGGRWVVFPQVAMGALMNTKLKSTHPRYWDERQLFAQKVCDFVLCHPKTLAPQLVIELDDVMHDFDRDRKRDCMAARAGYRTLRFWSRNKPSVEELKQHLDRALALN